MAEKLRQSIAALGIWHNAPEPASPLTVSIGLATMTPAPGTSCRLLILAADKGLYMAKHSGRNQVVVAD